MTTEEKFADAERILGYQCCVLTCPYNVNGRTICGDYREDHCTKKLFYKLTDSKIKYVQYDDDGNKILIENKCAFGDEPFCPLEPWVKEQDIELLNY